MKKLIEVKKINDDCVNIEKTVIHLGKQAQRSKVMYTSLSLTKEEAKNVRDMLTEGLKQW